MAVAPLSSDHERKPVPCMPMSAMPRDGIAHHVQDGENWSAIAQRYGFSDPWIIIEYNFHTRDPREVNWYLREYVGCNLKTPDGKNWRFSSSAYPGLIYIPRYHPGNNSVRFDKVWLGGGIRVSTTMLGQGRSRCILVLYNVESLFAPSDHVDGCYIEAEFKSPLFDIELGGDYLAVAATGFASALSFKGYGQSDLNVGGSAGFQQLGGFGMKEFVKALRSGPPANPTEVRDRFKNAIGQMGISRDGPRKMHFRCDGKMLIDLRNSVERVDIVGLSPLKLNRAQVSGPKVLT